MPANYGKPEAEAIRLARQDVNDRAAELERAQQVVAVAAVKLQAAHDRLQELLRNAKK